MKRLVLSALLLCSLTPALAGPKETPDGDDGRPVQGQNLPELKLRSQPMVRPALDGVDAKGGHYSPVIQNAAKVLDMDPQYAHQIREGLELVYLRNYKGARKHFAELDKAFPGTGISSAVNALIWQALMIENFDFRYNKQYEVANARALVEIEDAIKNEKHLGWTHFLAAGLVGVEAIHMVRHSKYVGALGRAFTALEHAEKARKAAKTEG